MVLVIYIYIYVRLEYCIQEIEAQGFVHQLGEATR